MENIIRIWIIDSSINLTKLQWTVQQNFGENLIQWFFGRLKMAINSWTLAHALLPLTVGSMSSPQSLHWGFMIVTKRIWQKGTASVSKPSSSESGRFYFLSWENCSKSPKSSWKSQTTFFERPHREALRPYGEVECPNDPSFQVIPSKVAGHVSKAYWTLQIRLTHRRKPTHRSLLVGGAIPVNCAWILDPQVMNK